jgi:predicted ATPase
MRIDKVHIKSRFKNLYDFQIDIDENAWETVLLGLNATGKSNFLEALVIIYRDLDLIYNHNRKVEKHEFDYYIKYECRENDIEVNLNNGKYSFKVNGATETTSVTKNIEHYLPKHVFIYYSGTSERLKSLYVPHQREYYKKIITEEASESNFNSIRRIFLAQNIHASFALIAFYIFEDQAKETIQFLEEEINIEDFGSALFMLKEPDWAKAPSRKPSNLWESTGLVRSFLEDLLEASFAPIEHKARIEVSYKKNAHINRLYLFLKDKATVKKLVKQKYTNNIELFNALESLYISDFLEDNDVRIKVKKKSVDGELSMAELSEGEKQLLTVLGLLKFTKDEESLVLLDEPDTHLNPVWKWKYLDFLDKVVKRKSNTQIIFCTHDPLVIGNLKKNQVQIFKKDDEGKTQVFNPHLSPREMSVFGIPSLMSKKLEDLLNQKRFLQAKLVQGKLGYDEQRLFERLKKYFDSIGFNDETTDSRYNQFLKLTSQNKAYINRKYTKEEAEELDEIANEILDEMLKEEEKEQ